MSVCSSDEAEAAALHALSRRKMMPSAYKSAWQGVMGVRGAGGGKNRMILIHCIHHNQESAAR